jgi:monofunctional biosynthetic peptidoglycan transglycosylase
VVLRLLLKSVGWLLLALVTASLLCVLALRWVNPPTTAVIATWQLESGRRASQVWQPLEGISPHLQMAVIAAEDQKFPDHHGFDIDSIRRALSEDRRRLRGASTITQQVAKNLFLWHGRSYLRKGIEAWFAVLMEMLWPKQRILEMYLNIAEFGEGVYGAEAAAQIFYRRSAHQLSDWQAGLLAAVLPNPKQMSAARPSDYVRSRATRINEMARNLGGTHYLERLSK